jgi:hypothetical protein
VAATPTPANQLLLGSSIRAKLTGQITTSGATPIVTLDDGSGLTVSLPGGLVVDVVSAALPSTQGSVVRASVNAGPIETLVLLPNANAVLKWRAADGFHNPGELDQVQVLYLTPPPSVPLPLLNPRGTS